MTAIISLKEALLLLEINNIIQNSFQKSKFIDCEREYLNQLAIQLIAYQNICFETTMRNDYYINLK